MNTRVFKDITKVQHRAWLGFTTRQVIFVLPAIAITILILGLNLFYWQFGDWFVYGLIFTFTIPLMLFGVYRPNNLPFEIYLKYRDRKSTRLNSSHANISYAVFCLKKK